MTGDSAGTNETCTFSTQAGFFPIPGCVWVYDNVGPFMSLSTITPLTGQIGATSTITLTFPEGMRGASVTTPQSMTISDGTDTVTLTNGVNATFTRIADAPGPGGRRPGLSCRP